MKTLQLPLALALILLASYSSSNAQTTQTISVTPDSIQTFGYAALADVDSSILNGHSTVSFNGIHNGQIYGTIDTHINPTSTPNSLRGSVLFDTSPFNYTIIDSVPPGDSANDFYRVLGIDGDNMIASKPNGSGGTNYFYNTPTDGYIQIPIPDWVSGTNRRITNASISGNYIAGSVAYTSGGSLNSGFVFDLTTNTSIAVSYPGYTRSTITAIDGNTVLGRRVIDPIFFLYDITTDSYTDLPQLDQSFLANGISNNIIYGSWNSESAYYDINTDTLTILDLSNIDSGLSNVSSTHITGFEGDTIVGNFHGSETNVGFIITVPEPTGALFLSIAGCIALLRRRCTA